MSADVKLLPLPEPGEAMSKWAYHETDMEAYARANMAELLAENERLREEVEAAKGRAAANLQRAADAEARAERLAEALREVDDYLAEREDVIDGDDGAPEANDEMRLRRIVNAALDQEGGND